MLLKLFIIAAWVLPAIAGAYGWIKSQQETTLDRAIEAACCACGALAVLAVPATLGLLAIFSWEVLTK